MIRSAYLAPEGFAPVMEAELARRGVSVVWHGALALSDAPAVPCAFSQNTWLDAREIPAPSVGAAADALRALQRNWGAYEAGNHRRIALIREKLPPLRARPINFPTPAPTGHLGAWTLLAPDLLLASPTQTSPWINGAPDFIENRDQPPSRAYLKLWEALTLLREFPGPQDRCIDLGACPGGWTWVCASLGAQVTAVDKAPLHPSVAVMPGVTMRRESAFGMDPASERTDWLFSDVIAYPERMLRLVQAWIAAGAARRIVCTLKFQGETDFATADAFAAIPGGRLVHLFHNKHELTFLWRV